jgi:hypothetical protein
MSPSRDRIEINPSKPQLREEKNNKKEKIIRKNMNKDKIIEKNASWTINRAPGSTY